MKFYYSIRFRIVVGILLYGILLVTINAGVTFFVMGKSMSRMVTNLIDTEVDTFKYKYAKDRATPLPHSKYINVYKGTQNLPERYKTLVKDLAPGIHIFNPTKNRPLFM